MMENIEKLLRALENEISAQKAALEMSAVTIPTVTKTASIQTTQNHISADFTDPSGEHYSYTMNAAERIEVTFDTARGSNTIATLGVNANYPDAAPRIQRVPYTGGARWIVTGQPHVDTSSGQVVWSPTTYDFSVTSMLDGILSVRNMES